MLQTRPIFERYRKLQPEMYFVNLMSLANMYLYIAWVDPSRAKSAMAEAERLINAMRSISAESPYLAATEALKAATRSDWAEVSLTRRFHFFPAK